MSSRLRPDGFPPSPRRKPEEEEGWMVVVPVDRGESKGERRIRREVWDWHATEKAEKADPGQLIVAQLASGISTPMGHLVSVRSTCHASAPSRYFCCLRCSLENKSEAAVTKGIYAYSPP